MKRWILFLIAIALGIFLISGEGKKPKGFSLERTLSHRAYDPRWQMHALSDEQSCVVTEALCQPYHFFNRGGQCSVFFSDDGKYVLKFLMKRLYTSPKWLDKIPFLTSYKEKKRLKKEDKLTRDFSSYQLAYESLADDTATLYLHLNPSSHLPTLKLFDHKKNTIEIDLNRFDFILQKRTALFPDALLAMIENKDLSSAKEAIDSLIDLVGRLTSQGIYDRDPSLMTNCGLLGTKAVKIDIGGFIQKENLPQDISQELKRTAAPLQKWLEKRDPELANYLKSVLENYEKMD
ncbi:MAG: hypothetical protein K2P51_02715 [Rhabdochlamydiaceae bacterium]|nr:hypothetical protein [Rhabdochlamydiaceae bacterium]